VARFNPAGGSIINISSVAAAGFPTGSVYGATKGAVDSITGALAQELGPKKIRVNSLSPGMIETEGAHAAGFIGGDFQKEIEKKNSARRIGQPGDIATVAAFLASDDSGWVTAKSFRRRAVLASNLRQTGPLPRPERPGHYALPPAVAACAPRPSDSR